MERVIPRGRESLLDSDWGLHSVHVAVELFYSTRAAFNAARLHVQLTISFNEQQNSLQPPVQPSPFSSASTIGYCVVTHVSIIALNWLDQLQVLEHWMVKAGTAKRYPLDLCIK